MSDVIKTNSIGKGIAETNPVIIEETPNTRLVFYPMVHDKGVRGKVIRYKKSSRKKWQESDGNDFKNVLLSNGEAFEIVLKTEALKILLEEVNKRQNIVSNGIEYGAHEYITVEKNRVILINNDNKRRILEQIIEKGFSDEYWEILEESVPELADSLVNARIQTQKKSVLAELEARLKNEKYPETSGDESWQSWVYENNWLFGVNYKKPIEKARINISGIMPDYLFPTLDNFVDILEIKLPTHEVIVKDKGHPGSWRWSSESNKAIGQVVNYLNEIDRLRLEIEKSIKSAYGYDLLILKPRAYILIGQNDTWNSSQKEGLRKLNHSLHGITVLTYTELKNRGQGSLQFSNV